MIACYASWEYRFQRAQRIVEKGIKFKMAAKTRSGGTQRVLQKLNKSIEDGEYYEAHQLIRTLYFR